MKVLYLATRLPAPPWRGDQLRAFHHLRLLASRHDVTCCALVLRPPPDDAVATVAALGVRVQVVPLGVAAALPQLARGCLGDRRPFQVLLYDRAAARRAVDALLARERFDVVHAQLVRTAAYLPAADGPPLVLDLVDALSANLRRRAARDRTPIGRVAACEAARVAREEQALIARARASLVVAEAERAALGGGRIQVVPNGVDLERFPLRAAPPAGARLLFAGNLGYFPNVDAARWLADDVFPRVRAAVPAAELHLAGARPTRAVRRLARRPGVTLAADVPDMAAELAAASVAVIPMRAGSGLQNKVLEAMAVGTPVVATPRAVAALDVEPGRHLLVAEEPAGIAAACVTLLGDPARGAALGRAARRLVEGRYGWAASAAAVEAAWEAARRGAARDRSDRPVASE